MPINRRLKSLGVVGILIGAVLSVSLPSAPSRAVEGESTGEDSGPMAGSEDEWLSLSAASPERIEVGISKTRGVYRAPLKVNLDGRSFEIGGFYVHMNKLEDGFEVLSTSVSAMGGRVEVHHVLQHPQLSHPTEINVSLWMAPSDPILNARVAVEGDGQHLDRLGLGDHAGDRLEAERMFFGRMYVLDKPAAFEHEHNYNTCRFWCWTMANGITELQATGGPAKGFRYDPSVGRYDMFTYCESPVDYQIVFTSKGPQEAIAAYRRTIDIPAPPTLGQLPGRVGVMTCYPIQDRYEDFLEEWTGRGAHDFVWLSYFPTPGDRARVEPFGALYATYDIYLDFFSEGPRKAEGWSPEMVQYRDTGKPVRGYWSSSWLLPELYVKLATTRVMGVFGKEFHNDQGENDFVPSRATRYSNLAITRAEVNPNALYLDVHASKAPHHYFDHTAAHHGAWNHMSGEKELFDFAREYLGGAPIWSEGGGEDYVGLMDGGWFMDWRPPAEEGINCEKWQYYPFIDQVHRTRLLNMGIYYPLETYVPEMVNAAILFGRPQGVSLYYNVSQTDVAGKLEVYYMTRAFHKMLGLSEMTRIDFHENDIDRCVVTYENGAQVWSNRGQAEWDVEGYTLPSMGFLVKGPGGFLEYRALLEGETVNVVQSDEYEFYSTPTRRNFGAVEMDGALAFVQDRADALTMYEVRKPNASVSIHLGEVRGTKKGQAAISAKAILTRGRELELEFPDFRQPKDAGDASRLGDIVQLRPVEMREALRYDITLSAVN